jgi:ribosomal protein S18 acetylase RimI-like enzyme
MSRSPPVHPIARADRARAGAVLARAFLNDPLYAHLLPDPDARARWMPGFWCAVLTYAERYGQVHAAGDLAGISAWLRPGHPTPTLWTIARTGFGLARAALRLPAATRRRMLDVARYVDEARRAAMPGPFWYLWALGVEPGQQGRGLGGALVAPILARADRERLPCYLETESEANVAFYERRGFRVVTDAIVPGQGVRLWTMARPAGT